MIAAAVAVGSLVVLMVIAYMWGLTRRGDEHHERLAVLEAKWAQQFGGPRPMAVIDEPATQPIEVETEPMPAVHLRDARSAVAAAREANTPRPTPFPRGRGAHRAAGQ